MSIAFKIGLTHNGGMTIIMKVVTPKNSEDSNTHLAANKACIMTCTETIIIGIHELLADCR